MSLRRYKKDIKPLTAASEALYALKPVNFRLTKEYDETQRPGFGLIAEEVEKVDSVPVYHNNNKGQAESVRYESVNAMLLNEFLEHRKGEKQDCKVHEQETTIAELESEMKALATRINEQASQLQKVSGQLQINNAAAQEIASNQP